MRSRPIMHALRVARFAVIGIVLLAAVGLVQDLFGGLAFTRHTTSWAVLIGGLVLTGLFTLVLEGGVEWITEGDRPTDPLPTRVSRLVLAIAFVAMLVAAVLFLAKLLAR